MVDLPDNVREAPLAGDVGDYDRQHAVTYLRLLDADAADAIWQDVVRHVFNADPASDPERLQQLHAAHLARAKYLRDAGYLQLLAQPAS